MSYLLRLIAVAALAAASILLSSSTARAFIYTDLRWSLDETTSTYGDGTQFHISQEGDGSVAYRWLDSSMTKTTVVSGNSCTDYYMWGKTTIYGGDTSYHTLFNGFNGQCFVVRGRTNPGAGSTTTHDARLRR